MNEENLREETGRRWIDGWYRKMKKKKKRNSDSTNGIEKKASFYSLNAPV